MCLRICSFFQLKEFLTVYNTLSELCFNACIRDFNSRSLVKEEEHCVNQCIQKHMTVNQRLMLVFSELGPARMSSQQAQQNSGQN